MVEHVNSHPSGGVSIPRAATSQLALPFVDGGLPTQSKIWMMIRAKVDALDTDTNGEHIPVTYGKDGEARTVNTDLDNDITDDCTHVPNDFYSNAKELDYTTTAKQGVSSVAMGLELTLTQTTPATPVLQALEIIFKATSPIIFEWDFEIDIPATEQQTMVDAETIITNLESAESNSVLVPLTYGQLGTKYVSVDALEFRPILMNDGTSMSGAAADEWDLRTGGTVLITVSQVVT